MGSLPTGIQGTPPFVGNGGPTGGGSAMDRFTALLQMLQKAGGQQGQPGAGAPRPGMTTPAMIGGAPPGLAGGPPSVGGVLPQPAQPAAPLAAYPRAQVTGAPAGQEFVTKGAARASTVNSAIQGVTQLIQNVKQKKADETRARAENTFNQIQGLLASGDPEDKKKAEYFLNDPKTLKLLEKGLNYEPLKEPPPPEAQGIHAATQKLAAQGGGSPLPGGGGGAQSGRAIVPQGNQVSGLQQELQRRVLQAQLNNPDVINKMATGSMLSTDEQKQMERISSGLQPSATDLAKMSQDQRKMYFDTAIALTDIQSRETTALKQIQSEARTRGAATAVDRMRAQAYKDYTTGVYDKNGKLTTPGLLQIQQSKTNGQFDRVLDMSIDAIRKHAASLNAIAQKYRKDDNTEQATDLENQAKTLEKQASDLEKNKANNVDSIVNNLLSGSGTGPE